MNIKSKENSDNFRNLLVYLLGLLSLSFFAWLAFYVNAGQTFLVDKEAFAVTFAMRNNSMTLLMNGITFLGSSHFLLPANILLVIWIYLQKRNRLLSLQWAITAIGSYLLMYFLKGFYERPRPPDLYLASATGFSFPSGHTLNGMVFFGLLILVLWKFARDKYLKIGGTAFFIIIILGIGISRIYLRVHYASDVLGGLALGLAWLIMTISFFKGMRKG